ncbi:MAG: exosortase/archaeosortase family protein [Euryarchaeota archaeon]|nr:exosortase/archaeosortase family protein [Euryarchaeota archaeon]
MKAGGAARRAGPSAGRAYIGLGLLGWGLAILVRVAPHEDPWVGAALAALGAGLLATAPRLPQVAHLPPTPVAALGLGAATSILLYDALLDAPLDVTKVAIIAWGLLLAGLAVVIDRTARIPFRKEPVAVATVVAYLIPALGFPFAVWVLQAAFKSLVGATPVEAFVHVALLLPLGLVLTAFGWHPVVDGQTILYQTPNGPLLVEVGAACSGVQAMALFGGVLALFLFIERPTGARLALWSAIGLAGVYAANLARLVALTVVGYAWGRDALLQVHEQAGWIFFVAWALLFARLARAPRPRPSSPPALGAAALAKRGRPLPPAP